ncbi:hypothetical protein NL676_035717 [Syzygium grande]|nr:hypothetical protein NL676_035717 [Syzygium grande]
MPSDGGGYGFSGPEVEPEPPLLLVNGGGTVLPTGEFGGRELNTGGIVGDRAPWSLLLFFLQNMNNAANTASTATPPIATPTTSPVGKELDEASSKPLVGGGASEGEGAGEEGEGGGAGASACIFLFP